jgi:hypothetical protein
VALIVDVDDNDDVLMVLMIILWMMMVMMVMMMMLCGGGGGRTRFSQCLWNSEFGTRKFSFPQPTCVLRFC